MADTEYKFVGKNLTPEVITAATAYLRSERTKSSQPLEGEHEKTDGQIGAITLAQDHLTSYMDSLAMPRRVVLDGNRVHLLEHDDFVKYSGSRDAHGLFSTLQQAVFVDLNKVNSPLELYDTLVHEGAHEYGLTMYGVYVSEINGLFQGLSEYRSGYSLEHWLEGRHLHFRDLHEAITERITIDVVSRNQAELFEKWPITPSMFNDMLAYPETLLVLNAIVSGVARFRAGDNQQADLQLLQQQFKEELIRGHVLGGLRPLIAIEETFGTGSLRVLAAAKTGLKPMSPNQADAYLAEYFGTADPERRVKIALSMLSERERFRFSNLRQTRSPHNSLCGRNY